VDQGIKSLSIKEFVGGSLDDPKEMRHVCLYSILKSRVIWLQVTWINALYLNDDQKKEDLLL